MKKKIIVVMLTLILSNSLVMAQFVVTNPVSDARQTLEQIANYGLQADSYARQALQLQQQILSYETMILNLERNPLGVVMPNLSLLVTNAARIKSMGVDIGNNMSKVGSNMEKAFKNPQGDFGVKFKIWTNASMDQLKGSMLTAGLHRENFVSDTEALQALIDKSQHDNGNLAALHTLGEFAAAQVQESMKLRDLITAQQLSANTFMMRQASIESAKQDQLNELMKPTTTVIPDLVIRKSKPVQVNTKQ